jgi:hypothetical protein
VRLVSFGEKVVFHLTDIGYWNPSLISFSGVTDKGDPVELIQRVSRISILLMTMQKQGSGARRIGFDPPEDQASK